MEPSEQRRFDELYQRHLRLLKLQVKSDKTIDVYVRAICRVTKHFDCCPDRLTPRPTGGLLWPAGGFAFLEYGQG